MPYFATIYPNYSKQKVWWLGKCGHEWQARVHDRSKGGNCPICSGKQILLGFNDLESLNPVLAKEWHPTKNGALKPTMITLSSGKKVWWRCHRGHEWEAVVANRAKGVGCPYCSNKKVLPGFNDLETLDPVLAKEWHPTKNGEFKSTMVSVHSRKKVWWECQFGHEWEASIGNRAKGSGCPICSIQKRKQRTL